MRTKLYKICLYLKHLTTQLKQITDLRNKRKTALSQINHLLSWPYKPQGNLSSSICCSNNISCPACHRPILEDMSMCNYSNKPIYVTSQITASIKNPQLILPLDTNLSHCLNNARATQEHK